MQNNALNIQEKTSFVKSKITSLLQFSRYDYSIQSNLDTLDPAIHFNQEYKSSCRHKVLEKLKSHSSVNPWESRKRALPKSIYSAFDKALKSGNPSDDILKCSLRRLSSRVAYLAMKRQDGSIGVFTGFQKGTERYNKKYAAKIMDFTKAISDKGQETFALTITCDQKRYSYNRFVAWKLYSEEVKKALEDLRKNYGCEYCWVKESTKKGFPHAHIVLSLPLGTVKGYDKMPNNKTLKYGWFYNYIKNHVASRVFELRAIKGNNLKYYLTKYISKYDEQSIFDIADKEGELSTEERKAVMCLLCTILTKTRQFGFTKIRCLSKEGGKRDVEYFAERHLRRRIKKACSNKLLRSQSADACARKRALLIGLCNNSLWDCEKECFISTFYHVRESLPDKNIKNPENIENIYNSCKKGGKKVGCGGCLYSALAKFVRGENPDFVNWFKKHLNYLDVDAPISDWFRTLDDRQYLYYLGDVFALYLEIIAWDCSDWGYLLNKDFSEEPYFWKLCEEREFFAAWKKWAGFVPRKPWETWSNDKMWHSKFYKGRR